MKKLAFVLVPLLLVACSTTKPNSSNMSGLGNTANSSSVKPSLKNGATTNNADTESKKLAAEKLAAEKLASELRSVQKQSIYFDFDQSEIKSEYRNVIQQQSMFLNAHKNDVVTVEGNCDERGSDEYNLALGDRRARTAQKSLELLGVSSTQIKTVSFGNEKPMKTCHDEECWKENRRDDFNHKLN